jgi:hypothetical protein
MPRGARLLAHHYYFVNRPATRMSMPEPISRCNDCGHQWPSPAGPCLKCGSQNTGRLFAMSFHSVITPTATLEAVADNSRGDQQTIQYLSRSGGRADSTLGPAQLDLTLRRPIDIGKKGEPVVVERVLGQLRADGHTISTLSHRDELGEDHLVDCDGSEVVIQVIGVPTATDFIGEASRGSASTSVSLEQAASWIRDAVAKKQAQYAPAVRATMLLALDVRAVGVLVSPLVADELRARHGDLCSDSGFAAIWLVGPSDSRCTRLPGCRW